MAMLGMPMLRMPMPCMAMSGKAMPGIYVLHMGMAAPGNMGTHTCS